MPFYIIIKIKLHKSKSADFINLHMPALKQAVEERFAWEFIIALQPESGETNELLNIWKLESKDLFKAFEQNCDELSELMQNTDACIDQEDIQFMQALPYSNQMFL